MKTPMCLKMIQMDFKIAIACIYVFFNLLNANSVSAVNTIQRADTLTLDGAWCWFGDPRAVYFKGINEQTYFSWVTKSGDMEVAAYNHKTGVYTKKTLYAKLQIDDHNNPSIFIRDDGRLVVFFSKHSSGPMHRFISTNPEDISSWGTDYTFGTNVTYPNPFKIGNQIAVFFRDINWHPSIAISTDNGQTFGTTQQFIQGGGGRPYIKYCSDKNGTIHFAFTDGHPRDSYNKVYYACYKNGKFYKADGTYIKDFTGSATALNLDTYEAEVVYDASAGKGWVWDIAIDKLGNPVVVYASFPSNTDHRYNYAKWDGTKWTNLELTKAGKWFEQTPVGVTEPEPNYSGGISLDANNTSVVYLSKPVNNVFEIFKWTSKDSGVTWDSLAITQNTSPDLINVRPIVPRNHKPGYFDVLWMKGKYIYYTNYNTSVLFHNAASREYDFGAATSETNLEGIKVLNNKLYEDDFGFADISNIESKETPTGALEKKSFVYSATPKTFKLSLPNGSYKVKVLQGDMSAAHDNMQIAANGSVVATNINTNAGAFIESEFNTTVANKLLEITLSDNGGVDPSWVLNSIKIETLNIPIQTVSLDADSIQLYIGSSRKLNVTSTPFIATDKNVIWSSSNNNVATVSNGNIISLGKGLAVISATCSNGYVANCKVLVEEPVYLTNATFDFGTTTSPLLSGAIRVSESTLINNSYGWLSLSGLLSRDRGTANTDELRDFMLCPSPATFKAFVQNGSYHVTVKQGDATYAHDKMKIEVNGAVAVPSVSSAINAFVTSEFDVTANNNSLEFTFSDGGGTDVNWVLNSLQLKTNSLSATQDVELNKFSPNAEVLIIDLTGKIISNTKLGQSGICNLVKEQNIAKGIYLLKINDAVKSKVMKVVKAD